jgi:hypothetical protein
MNYILLGLYFSYKSQRLLLGKGNKQVGNELIPEVDLRKSDVFAAEGCQDQVHKYPRQSCLFLFPDRISPAPLFF